MKNLLSSVVFFVVNWTAGGLSVFPRWQTCLLFSSAARWSRRPDAIPSSHYWATELAYLCSCGLFLLCYYLASRHKDTSWVGWLWPLVVLVRSEEFCKRAFRFTFKFGQNNEVQHKFVLVAINREETYFTWAAADPSFGWSRPLILFYFDHLQYFSIPADFV